MSKYPRDQEGFFGLDTTAFLWTVIGAALLAGGFFLFGMYYGYQQGYQAAQKNRTDDQPSEQVASAPTGAPDAPGDPQGGSSSEDRQQAITEDQLTGFGVSDEEEEKAEDTSPSPTLKTTPPDSDREPGGPSSYEPESSSGQTEDQPRALSVSDVDSGKDQSGLESEDGRETTDTDRTGTQAGDSGGPTFTIQAVSFLKKPRAEREVQELKSAGYDATITEKIINGRKWYRVRVGSFSDRNQANGRAEEMKEKGVIDDYWISKVKK